MNTTIKSTTLITFLVLFAIPSSQIAIDIYLPSLPSMTANLHASDTALQLTFTFYLIGLGISQVFYGFLTDKLGRRPILQFGLLVFVIGSIVCIFSKNVLVLNMARLLQGLGGGSVFVVTNAIWSDVFSGEQLVKRVTYGSLTWSLVPILAPALGGVIQQYIGWQANFYVMAIYGLIALILIAMALPETLIKDHKQSLSIRNLFISYLNIILHLRFLCFIGCVIFSWSAVIVFSIVGPFVFQNLLHVSASLYGILVLTVGVAYTIGTFLNGFFLKYYKMLTLLMVGIVLMLISGLMLLAFTLLGWFNIMAILIPTCLLQIAQGFIFANCLSGALNIFSTAAGSVSSLFGSVVVLGVTLISATVARVNINSELGLAISYILLGILTLFCFFPLWQYFRRISVTTASS